MDEQYEIGAIIGKCIAVLSLAITVLAYVQHGISLPLAFFVVFMAPTIRTHLGKRAARGVYLQQTLPALKRQLNEDISDANTSTENLSTQDRSLQDTFPVPKVQSRNAPSGSTHTGNRKTESNATTQCRKGKNKKRVTFANTVTNLDDLQQLRRNKSSY
ncbi:hypothetical protein F4814DRAFT_447343 [Daldinia grandis]|nr:hypothetical protein F4814DRAFT_447343 [Daldinia grandis]